MLQKFFKSNRKIQISSNAEFWDWFVRNEARFYKAVKYQRNIHKQFFNELSSSLGKLRNGYFFLAGMYDDDTAELVLTADGNAKNIVFVEELIEQAPELSNWMFTALKRPTLNVHEGLEMHGYTFSSDNVSFYAKSDRSRPDSIDITFTHTNLNDENRSEIINGVYLLIENYLGELNMLTMIDELSFENPIDAEQPLNTLDKLNDFLIWREKEFIEKYEGMRKDTENDKHGYFEATLKNGLPLIAVVNTDLLNWDAHPSHPWIALLEIKYHGESNGLPNKEIMPKLYAVENAVLEKLEDKNGYLFVGSQTSENSRILFYACKEFRYPSKVMDQIITGQTFEFDMEYDIYKDKYWQSFDRFRPDNI